MGERLVELGDDRGSFANRCGDALRRSRAHVTDRKNSWLACFEFKRYTPNVQVCPELTAGLHEPPLIDFDATA
jgi:hypothetical protein